MRKSIRIARLIRRRRFRYRRLHIWRFDILAVMILFGAGWLLLPPINQADRSSPKAVRMGTLAVIEKPMIDRDATVLSPAMFAFTAPEGFAYGVVAAQLSDMGGEIPFIPPIPTRFYSISALGKFQDISLACVKPVALPKLPPPPVFPTHGGSNTVSIGEARVYASIPGVVPTGHFRSTQEKSAGKSVRIAVHFGADGRADSVVLFSHALDVVDAARVERDAMRLTGPPNQSAWILLSSK